MSEDSESPYAVSRKEAHELLDDLLDIEDQLAQLAEGPERGYLAKFNADLFHALSNYFPEFSLAISRSFNEGRPFTDLENTGESDAIQAWRAFVAESIRFNVPLSVRNRDRIATALSTLNYGEVSRLLVPTSNSKRTRNWTVSRYQFLAAMHSRVIRGSGEKAYVAREIVADSYGCSGADAIRAWELREIKQNFKQTTIRIWANASTALGKMGFRFNDQTDAEQAIIRTDQLMHDKSVQLAVVAMTLSEFNLEIAGPLCRKAIAGEQVVCPEIII